MRIHMLVWGLVTVKCSQKRIPKKLRDEIDVKFKDVTVNFSDGIVSIRSESGSSWMISKKESVGGYGGFSMSYGKATIQEMTPWTFIIKAYYLSGENYIPVDIMGLFESDS